MLETFQRTGKQADVIERLNNLDTEGAILVTTGFSILLEIPSEPEDFLMSCVCD